MAWTIDTELLALTSELIHTHIRASLAVAGVKAHKLPPILEIPRPYQPPATPKSARRATVADLAAAFGGSQSITIE